MKKLFLFVAFLLIIANSEALTIYENTSFNTSQSNSSITFDSTINATNITINENFITIYGITFENNTGNYSCENVNHSMINSNLKSSDFTCTLIGSEIIESPPESSSKTSYYLFEPNKYSNSENILLKIKMKKNTQKEINLSNSKETEIISIKINAKNYISGEISFSNLKKVEPTENKNIYKIIEINSSIDPLDLENVSILMKINHSWENKNNIYQIKAKKETNGEIKTKLISQNGNYSIYEFSSEGFSTWTIYGEERQAKTTPKELNFTKEENETLNKIIPEVKIDTKDPEKKIKAYLYLTIAILFLILFLIFFNSKKKK